VVKKANAGIYGVLAGAIKIDGGGNTGFFGAARDSGGAHR
jgi:hypothetical protein